jgi:hypothetical protein
MKAIRLFLCLLALAVPALADSLQDSVETIQRNTALLVARVRPEGATLTWGQDLAAQDMERLARAAAAIQPDQADDMESLAPLVNEMSSAATRVRSTASISALDEAGQALALATVDEIKLLQKVVSEARQIEERQYYARDRYYGRPSFSLGFGFGGWYPYGYPYGYGGWYPYPVGIYRNCGVRRCR